MAKKVLTLIKLQIPGGQANPAPPGICSLMSVSTFFAIGVRAGLGPSSYLSGGCR